MEEKELPSSDDSDSDFEVNLEEELSGDSEQSDAEGSGSEAGEEEEERSSKKKTRKGKTRRKKTKKATKKTRSSNVEEEVDSNSKQSSDTDSKLTAEQEKERADSLWKSFLSDTSIPIKSEPSTPKTKSSPSSIGKKSVEAKKEESEKQEKQTSDTKTGNVEETRTKALDIRELPKPSLKSPLTSTNENGNKVISPLLAQENSSKKRGLSSLLGNMQKKAKLSTLEKSKLDWNQFKEENNLQEEITTFNRGKNGYLDKQDFLQRADTRQFELEKELRNVGRRKNR